MSLPDIIIQMKANKLAGVSTVSHTRYVSAPQSDQQQLENIICVYTTNAISTQRCCILNPRSKGVSGHRDETEVTLSN